MTSRLILCNPKFGSRSWLTVCILLLILFISWSCNEPFQPEVQYTPKLNVYAVLFADAQAVYVRVASVVKTQSDVSQPVHGASVKLVGVGPGMSTQGATTLVDTTEIVDGDTASFYYAPLHIFPGGNYTITVTKDGYPAVSGNATVPFGYAAVPDQSTYSVLKDPERAFSGIDFKVNLSSQASAAFVQMLVEYRGLDAAGKFHAGSFDVFPVDSVNPFTETESTSLEVEVDTAQYRCVFNLARKSADSLTFRHMYVDIIVTQVDNSLYRFFITSTRTVDPLLMRTDKIIFTNIFMNAGTGIVAGASIDTTRIFLF